MMTQRLFRSFICRCLAVLALLGAAPTGIKAQEAERLAAVVNEDIISMHDLEHRMRLTMMFSNLPDNIDSRKRVGAQVMRRLIEERIEIQEAERLKVAVGSAEVANGIANLERQNKMPRGTLEPYLKNKGIDPDSLRQQVRAELSWVRAVRRELMPDLKIGEEEIDARLDAIRASLGKPEYLAAEISLPVEDPSREEEMHALALKLIDLMKQGAPFSALARQFSQSGAAAGGDLGWVSEGMLDDELMTPLAALGKGEVTTPPVRAIDGYHLLLLRDKRIAGEGVTAEPTLDIAQIILPNLPSSTAADRQDLMRRLKDAVAGATTCDEFEKRSKKVPAADWNHPGKVMPSELPSDVAALVASLKAGETAVPQDPEGASRMLIMCGRVDPANNGLPSRDDVRRKLEDERIGIMAARYLRDLKRAAFVEIRV